MSDVHLGRLTRLKFGDIVENQWASEDNPHRVGIFVRFRGANKKYLELTDGKGNFYEVGNDGHNRSRNVTVGSWVPGEPMPKPTPRLWSGGSLDNRLIVIPTPPNGENNE